jgi:hypothetical protein
VIKMKKRYKEGQFDGKTDAQLKEILETVKANMVETRAKWQAELDKSSSDSEEETEDGQEFGRSLDRQKEFIRKIQRELRERSKNKGNMDRVDVYSSGSSDGLGFFAVQRRHTLQTQTAPKQKQTTEKQKTAASADVDTGGSEEEAKAQFVDFINGKGTWKIKGDFKDLKKINPDESGYLVLLKERVGRKLTKAGSGNIFQKKSRNSVKQEFYKAIKSASSFADIMGKVAELQDDHGHSAGRGGSTPS